MGLDLIHTHQSSLSAATIKLVTGLCADAHGLHYSHSRAVAWHSWMQNKFPCSHTWPQTADNPFSGSVKDQGAVRQRLLGALIECNSRDCKKLPLWLSVALQDLRQRKVLPSPATLTGDTRTGSGTCCPQSRWLSTKLWSSPQDCDHPHSRFGNCGGSARKLECWEGLTRLQKFIYSCPNLGFYDYPLILLCFNSNFPRATFDKNSGAESSMETRARKSKLWLQHAARCPSTFWRSGPDFLGHLRFQKLAPPFLLSMNTMAKRCGGGSMRDVHTQSSLNPTPHQGVQCISFTWL